MITEKQQADWLALVDYLRPQGNGACLNELLEEGPDNILACFFGAGGQL